MLCELALSAIDKINPHLHAVIERFAERVPAADYEPDLRAPFCGVPFLVKDFPMERGTRAEMGSVLAAGFEPECDSELMIRFRRAGLLNLGRSTTSELGLMALTVSERSGITRNPWDLSRSTAGSSGGSAAAVAAGMVPIASGGDGGGSIRNPASFCGLVGLKPSRGRISLGPDSADAYSGMVTGFVLTRTVRDCAAMLDAVAGYAVGDPVEIAAPPRPYLDETTRPAERLRIAFTSRTWSGLPVDPEIATAVQSTARVLEQLGHVVIEDTPQFDYEVFLNAQIDLWVAHTATAIDAVAQTVGRQPSKLNLQATTWAVYEAGRRLPATQFLQAEEIYNQIRRKVARFFLGYDVLLTPTSAIVPPVIDAQQVNVAGASVRDLFDHLAPIEAFTALFNATGQPAISLPLHCTAGGLPVGMQFVGRHGDESALLRLAAQLELALPWHARRPRVHASVPS